MKTLSENNNTNEVNDKELKIIYVLYIGKNADNDNIYHFLISEDSEMAWADG